VEPSTPRYTAIVRRSWTVTFERLTKTTDRVMWDRRVAERRVRMEVSAGGTERRRGERRRPPPGSWDTKGFLVARIA
jgi:hypothetical protein